MLRSCRTTACATSSTSQLDFPKGPMTRPFSPAADDLLNKLVPVLDHETLRQMTRGKGRERHQRGRDFVDQPILVIPALLGGDIGLGGLLYQAMKKVEEASGLPHERRIAELRGAVIYTLAAIIHVQRAGDAT